MFNSRVSLTFLSVTQSIESVIVLSAVAAVWRHLDRPERTNFIFVCFSNSWPLGVFFFNRSDSNPVASTWSELSFGVSGSPEVPTPVPPHPRLSSPNYHQQAHETHLPLFLELCGPYGPFVRLDRGFPFAVLSVVCRPRRQGAWWYVVWLRTLCFDFR